MARVCGYMGVSPEEIDFQVLNDEEMPGAAGQFEPAPARSAPSDLDFQIPADPAKPETAGQPPPGVVRIAASQLEDAESLVATVAHELAHAILARRKALEGEPDREWVTDLLPVFQGLGVFLANATLRESSVRGGRGRWWSLRKHGYLSAQTLGYALAMFAWIRREREPSWAKHLRLDAADTLRRGLRYLEATEDAAFHPSRPSARPGKLTVYQLVDQIREGSPSACVAALWELGRRGAAAAEGVEEIHGCLSHSLADIRAEAARTLAALGPVGRPAVPTLVEVLDDADAEVRAATAFALGKLGVQSEEATDVVAALAERLGDSDTEAACAAAWAMAQFGRGAASSLPAVLDALTQAISRTCYEEIDYVAYALQAIAVDPEAALRDVVASCDPEIRPQAVALLAEQGGQRRRQHPRLVVRAISSRVGRTQRAPPKPLMVGLAGCHWLCQCFGIPGPSTKNTGEASGTRTRPTLQSGSVLHHAARSASAAAGSRGSDTGARRWSDSSVATSSS